MTKLLTALKRTFGTPEYVEPPVHFHNGADDDYPEVCYDADCLRPRLQA